jgi:hypothetical protein
MQPSPEGTTSRVTILLEKMRAGERGAVDVAQIGEHDSDVVAEERKAQFGGMKDGRVPARREASNQVPRARLILGKAAVRTRAAAKNTLGQGT